MVWGWGAGWEQKREARKEGKGPERAAWTRGTKRACGRRGRNGELGEGLRPVLKRVRVEGGVRRAGRIRRSWAGLALGFLGT